MWRGSLFIYPIGTIVLASRGVFREQDETLAQLQELDALARVVCLLCGICAGPCLIEVVALSTHVSDSTILAWRITQQEKGRFPESAER
jgi:hypothetical protein